MSEVEARQRGPKKGTTRTLRVQKCKRLLPDQWEAVEALVQAWDATNGPKILKYIRSLIERERNQK